MHRPPKRPALSFGLALIRRAVFCLGLAFAGFVQAEKASPPQTPSPTPTSAVAFDVRRGLYSAPITVTLTSEAPVIRYTTDGREPTATIGTPYTAPLRITNTTILRSAAFSGTTRVSPVETHSYLFPSDIIRQGPDPKGFPAGQSAWGGEASSYGMDRRITDDPVYRDRMVPALRSLPSVSMVFARAHFFGADKGIYLNSLRKGIDWERPVSVEWIDPLGGPGFQIDCGARVQGNYNRRPDKSPKHSFRLLFKKEYGAPKLRAKIFPDSRVEKFDTLVLRSDYNNSWIHWDSNVAARGQRIRDAWMKDSQRAMGWLSPHSRPVHLYLDGLYWGIYDIAERPDGSFASSYTGGAKEDYDVINEFEVKGGTGDAFRAMRSARGLAAPARYEQLGSRLDLAEYADYLLLNYYAGNRDWGENKNWYAVRPRVPAGPFRYYVWDGEQIFQGVREDIVNHPYEVPFALAHGLRENAEFRLLFADRVQKHCFGDGALTPDAVAARWMSRAREIDLAIVAESARWGGYRRDPPYNRDQDWIAEQRRLTTRYFPVRTTTLLGQLKAAGLYPAIPAPVAEVASTTAGAPARVTLVAPAANLYYTLDGTDPRLPGSGKPTPSAVPYAAPIASAIPATLKCRAEKDGVWSALMELHVGPR